MKKLILALAVLASASSARAATAVTVYANAIGSVGGVKAFSRTIDSNGQPIAFNADKPWNVFEYAYSTTIAQIVDNKGLAPKTGIFGKICVDTGLGTTAAPTEWTNVYDSSTTSNGTVTFGAQVVGRRLGPSFIRASGVITCTEINAQFTSGLTVQSLDANGAAWIYWK